MYGIMSGKGDNDMMVKVNMFPFIQRKETKLGRSLTSREMSRGADIHESTFSAYRSGSVRMVKLDTLEKLADYFGCAPGDLLVKAE